MRILIEEYVDAIITIIGGLVILTVIISTCLQTKIDIMHSEDINKMNPLLEKIGRFECKDVLIDNLDDNLLKDVIAFSNSGKDISSYVTARIKNDGYKYYVEYILKYNNDFMVKKSKCYIKEESDESDV